MKRFLKLSGITVLVCIMLTGALHAAVDKSAESVKRVLVEAIEVQLSGDVSEALGTSFIKPDAEVNMPVAKLLWLFAEPNSVKLIESLELIVLDGQTAKVGTAKQIEVKYSVKEDVNCPGWKVVEIPVETSLEATPSIDKDGDIVLNFDFKHFVGEWLPKDIEPKMCVVRGGAAAGCTVVKTRIELKSGEPIIAGGQMTGAGWLLVLVRAVILE